jgi:hypothetical protein
MSPKQARSVRLERQPHRHGLLRLRQVYHKLWQSQQPDRPAVLENEIETKASQVQEVTE